jgi:hypothetical protein
MSEPKHVIGLSGGKDSTSMALRLKEIEPREYEYIATMTGNELPVMHEHLANLERLLGKPILRLGSAKRRGADGLLELIEEQQMLPNFRARWCTRILKIEPTIEYMESLPPGSTLYVGLRADEEERQGIYGEDIAIDFPMRRWGWGEADVWRYLGEQGIKIPNRSDCAWCYGQRLGEWYALWKKHPDVFEQGVEIETRIGHTFRSAQRDTWPAALVDLREAFKTRGAPRGAEAAMREDGACRVCRL